MPVFGCEKEAVIRARVLDPVPTAGMSEQDTERLAAEVRERMIAAHRDLEPDLEPLSASA